jgi:hypothetical protein
LNLSVQKLKQHSPLTAATLDGRGAKEALHILATASFVDLDGKTKLTYSTVFEENAAVFDKVKTYAVPGAEQTMDRLEEHLASMS